MKIMETFPDPLNIHPPPLDTLLKEEQEQEAAGETRKVARKMTSIDFFNELESRRCS